jgi:hypothetical protein
LSISVLPKLGGTAVLRWTGAASALLAKVTRAAGAITIELGGTSTEVLLRVADTGGTAAR